MATSESPDNPKDAIPGSPGSEIEHSADEAAPQISKNQMKKMLKRENWLQYKHLKRKQQKVKLKERRRKMRDLGEDMGPSRKQLKHNKMKDSTCQVQVVVDCSFEHLMSDKDILHLVQQLNHAYSANRRSMQPVQFHVTGVKNKIKARLDDVGDYINWDVNFHAEDYLEVFNKQDVVYLSSESANMLEELTDDKVYVIGGLVDHNHHKGLCHRLAEEKGLAHAQLPIGDYLELKSRKVLTINHVFEILLRYTENKSWKESFFSVIPKRKGAKIKSDIPAARSSAALSSDVDSHRTIEQNNCVKRNDAICCDSHDKSRDSEILQDTSIKHSSKGECVSSVDQMCGEEKEHVEVNILHEVENCVNPLA